MAGNLSCGNQVWSALTRFFLLSFCSFSMCVYTQSTALSFLPKPGSNYTLSLCCSRFSSATNPNLVVNTSFLQVLHLPEPSLHSASFKSHQAGADVTLVTSAWLLSSPSVTALPSVIPIQQGRVVSHRN